jgi:3-dehydroquinate synthase
MRNKNLLRLPKVSDLAAEIDSGKCFAVIDQRVLKIYPQLKKIFPSHILVKSGESLKTWAGFQNLAEAAAAKVSDVARNELQIVAVGGGSVGDVAGFLASIFKRGVQLFHIPTTWLAAIDSAHGGKNGINSAVAKNQFGTIYPATKVILIREILLNLPKSSLRDAMGEALKIGLIEGGELWKSCKKIGFHPQRMYAALPSLISAKMKWVNKDLYETKNIRTVLNLGHTVGHVIEIFGKIPHGRAVALGLLFSLAWSFEKNYLPEKDFLDLSEVVMKRAQVSFFDLTSELAKVSRPLQALSKDKKTSSSATINEVFLYKLGKPTVEKIKIQELVEFWEFLQAR